MSRAFVNEDAAPAPVHWRRRSPATEGGRSLTLSGAARFRAELQRLKTGEHPTSESSQRIAFLEETLARSEIVDVRTLAGKQVTFGATVALLDVESGGRFKYQIVGELEADLKLGRVSVGAPLARALIGREVGELVQVQAPGGGREYEILDLNWEEDGGASS